MCHVSCIVSLAVGWVYIIYEIALFRTENRPYELFPDVGHTKYIRTIPGTAIHLPGQRVNRPAFYLLFLLLYCGWGRKVGTLHYLV